MQKILGWLNIDIHSDVIIELLMCFKGNAERLDDLGFLLNFDSEKI